MISTGVSNHGDLHVGCLCLYLCCSISCARESAIAPASTIAAILFFILYFPPFYNIDPDSLTMTYVSLLRQDSCPFFIVYFNFCIIRPVFLKFFHAIFLFFKILKELMSLLVYFSFLPEAGYCRSPSFASSREIFSGSCVSVYSSRITA